jgi:transposase
MNLEKPSFDPTTFTNNRDWLLEHLVAVKFFDRMVNIARKDGLLSDDHFTVDGTLVEAPC